eukprot:jgi/Chrzof1/6174/Cz17g14090.t1
MVAKDAHQIKQLLLPQVSEATLTTAKARFEETCKLTPALSAEHQSSIWDTICSNYNGQHRHYHNLQHLLAMFDFLKKAGKAGYPVQNAAAIDWAVWLHDIIYDPSMCT